MGEGGGMSVSRTDIVPTLPSGASRRSPLPHAGQRVLHHAHQHPQDGGLQVRRQVQDEVQRTQSHNIKTT